MPPQGVTDLAELTPNLIRGYMLDLEGARVKPNTVHSHMRAVRALLNFMEREGDLDDNPMRRVKMPRLQKVILQPFTEDEIGRVLAKTQGNNLVALRNRAIILTFLDTGLRRLAELASLYRL